MYRKVPEEMDVHPGFKDSTSYDPAVLTGLAAGRVAAWIPARHALGVGPMILLRYELSLQPGSSPAPAR